MGEMHTTLELRKGLAERLFTLAEREGMSVEEFLSRAIELYTREKEIVTKAMQLSGPEIMFLEEL
jgi:predicted HTH domain antitoxin